MSVNLLETLISNTTLLQISSISVEVPKNVTNYNNIKNLGISIIRLLYTL
jgi:hypothetical protein